MAICPTGAGELAAAETSPTACKRKTPSPGREASITLGSRREERTGENRRSEGAKKGRGRVSALPSPPLLSPGPMSRQGLQPRAGKPRRKR